MKTYNLSSNWTVVLKYFVPLIWTIFFGALCIIFWVTDELAVGTWNLLYFRIAWTVLFLFVVAFQYFTLMRLMRVETDGDFVYVTNYFKIFKYPLSNVEKLTLSRYGIFKIVTLQLKEAGYFGKKVLFLASKSRFEATLKTLENVGKLVKH